MLFEGLTKKPPSLVDLCVRKAIDNVKYIGYVGGVDFHLLEEILQHCTIEQLMHIEDSTQDTDLSPVTNKFWKGFFEKQFREEDAMEELKLNEVKFNWRDSYEENLIAVEVKEKEAVNRLRQHYKNEIERKQCRQTLSLKMAILTDFVAGDSASGYSLGNVKSNILKKAKLDLLKSQEVKNLTANKRKTIPQCFRISAPKRIGLSANAPSTSRSTPFAGQKLPPKRINNLPGIAPSTSKNVATRQKHVM